MPYQQGPNMQPGGYPVDPTGESWGGTNLTQPGVGRVLKCFNLSKKYWYCTVEILFKIDLSESTSVQNVLQVQKVAMK